MRPLLLVAALALVAGCQTSEPRVFSDDPKAVPNVVGETAAEARRILEGEGLLVEAQVGRGDEARDIAVDACSQGEVTGQDAAPGSAAIRGQTVLLTLSGC